MMKTPVGYGRLLKAIETTNSHMVGRAAAVVNQGLILRNWLVGAHLVEYEQDGLDRARYGERLLERLSDDLKEKKIKGLDVRALRDCRLFFRLYPQIRGSVPPELQRSRGLVLLTAGSSPGKVSAQVPPPLNAKDMFRFSWTHILEFVRIEDAWKRAFYENECLKGHWSVRQLQRQIETLLYERTGLSSNKRRVIERARRQSAGAPSETFTELMRDPYVLEFTGLAEREAYSENDLETALLNHLQRFLLELGAGFCFEARQFRITMNNRHDRVDLVFYHRRLRCHVLLDLKIRAFRHADAGQMNFYLNWFKNHMMAKGDIPPVGILLCSDKDQTVVEFATTGMKNKLFVSRYMTALPSAVQLKKLVEADRAQLKPGRTTAKDILS